MNTPDWPAAPTLHLVRTGMAAMLILPFLIAVQSAMAVQTDGPAQAGDPEPDDLAAGETRYAPPEHEGILLFRSGFEPGARVIPMGNPLTENDKIIGRDDSVAPPNDWVQDIDNSDRLGFFSLHYQGGDTTIRRARIVPEPGNPDNHVLLFEIREPWVNRYGQDMARVQANIYDTFPNSQMESIYELYQEVRLFLPEDIEILRDYPDRITFLMFMEFWNNHSWDNAPYPFRISLGMGKPRPGSGDLYFMVDAEDYVTPSQRRKIWSDLATAVPIPFGTWMTLEVYVREGGEEDGYFFMAMTSEGGERKVLFNTRNYTHNTTDPAPEGITHWNPMKLYTSRELVEYLRDSGTSLRFYWDDLEIWKDRRPVEVATALEAVDELADEGGEMLISEGETQVADDDTGAEDRFEEPGIPDDDRAAPAALAPGHYIQLISTRSRETARQKGEEAAALLEEIGEVHRAQVILASRKERQIFEVLIGAYNDYRSGVASLETLEGKIPADSFIIAFPRHESLSGDYPDMVVVEIWN
jgi:hypothetical protein